jgi:hypothetical protein
VLQERHPHTIAAIAGVIVTHLVGVKEQRRRTNMEDKEKEKKKVYPDGSTGINYGFALFFNDYEKDMIRQANEICKQMATERKKN